MSDKVPTSKVEGRMSKVGSGRGTGLRVEGRMSKVGSGSRVGSGIGSMIKGLSSCIDSVGSSAISIIIPNF